MNQRQDKMRETLTGMKKSLLDMALAEDNTKIAVYCVGGLARAIFHKPKHSKREQMALTTLHRMHKAYEKGLVEVTPIEALDQLATREDLQEAMRDPAEGTELSREVALQLATDPAYRSQMMDLYQNDIIPLLS